MPAKGAMTEVILNEVSRSFGVVQALRSVSLRLSAGEVVAVVGPSGCGKSTLLELVCGLQEPDSGTVEAPRAALMAQDDHLLPWLSALDNAALAPRFAGATRQQARDQAIEVLAAVGLADFAAARPAQLSGGMRQRVAFARTLLSGAPVLCLDEPFASLDAITRADAHAWLQGALAEQPRTVLLVTHDVEEAALLADRVVVFGPRPGHIVSELTMHQPHPRHATDEAVLSLRSEAMKALT
jgi:NitT/TauT family transport system ATP-binding protein